MSTGGSRAGKIAVSLRLPDLLRSSSQNPGPEILDCLLSLKSHVAMERIEMAKRISKVGLSRTLPKVSLFDVA